jgi:hypothetical protein
MCGDCDSDGSSCEFPELFDFTQSTLQAFYYFEIATINNVLLDTDDWVGAFNDDVCVGARKWDTILCGGGVCDVPVMGYDAYFDPAGTEGYMVGGEIPSFKIYDASENAYYDAVASENIPWENNNLNMLENLNVYPGCFDVLGGTDYDQDIHSDFQAYLNCYFPRVYFQMPRHHSKHFLMHHKF